MNRLIRIDSMPKAALACLAVTLIALMATTGCGKARPKMASVSGRVLYRGQPLQFGGVMFQPEGGWPARGTISPEGTFELSTYDPGDGAAVGKHRVRVTCYEAQKPGFVPKGDGVLGPLLIPEKYTSIETSGLAFEVRETNEPFVIELQGP